MTNFTRMLALGALTLLISAPQALADKLQSDATVYVGTASVTDGFHDRQYAGAFINNYSGDFGFHADVSYVDREEDGLFAAVGFSWQASDNWRPKLMVGSSTDNFSILPEIFVALSAQYKSDGDNGWTVTPSFTYREYRNNGDEFMPAVDFNKYFSAGDTSGYWVLQGRVALSFNNSHDTGYTIGGGIQTVRNNGLTAGLYLEGGKMTYDSIIGIGVETDYWAIRPSIGYRFSSAHEVFIRGEFADTDFYSVQGVMVGTKFTY